MITLRRWTLADVDELVALADNKKIADNLRDRFPNPYTHEDAEFYIQLCRRDRWELSRAVELDGKIVGCISLSRENDVSAKTSELGYWIGENFWGRGIATAAVKKICTFGFEELGLVRIFAIVFEKNFASMRVLEKCGFEREGRLRKAIFKNGAIQDAFLYSLIV